MIRMLFIPLAMLAAVGVQAHPGGTNKDGCHAGSKPYHCHGDGPAEAGGPLDDEKEHGSARVNYTDDNLRRINSWREAKNLVDDKIYRGRSTTFYCGCRYRSDGDSDGSGKITDIAKCGYREGAKYRKRAGRVEWEHVVPASLMPARRFSCWAKPGGSRRKCEKTDGLAKAMIFDLHNLVPSIGQINALRSNDRYAEIDGGETFGKCGVKDASTRFEPPDCKKGDVARIWLYMRHQYKVKLSIAEEVMFHRWAEADPISPWESERERRISKLTGISNPFISGFAVANAGACPCEAQAEQ